MPAERAPELRVQALSALELTDTDIIARVRARYPEARPLLSRPGLDVLLGRKKLALHWDPEHGYVRPETASPSSLHRSTTSLGRGTTVMLGQRSKSAAAMSAQDFEDSFLASCKTASYESSR
jgi:hypothetical protein